MPKGRALLNHYFTVEKDKTASNGLCVIAAK